MPTQQQLIRAAKNRGVTVDVQRGKFKGVQGVIELRTKEGEQFAPELHALVTMQTKYKDGTLEPFNKTVIAAYIDLMNNAPHIAKCPADCPCKDD